MNEHYNDGLARALSLYPMPCANLKGYAWHAEMEAKDYEGFIFGGFCDYLRGYADGLILKGMYAAGGYQS